MSVDTPLSPKIDKREPLILAKDSLSTNLDFTNENPAWRCCHKSGLGVRNLIVCIDGTANQFGQKNTNVIELYNLILKEAGHNQLTWYNSGIGTYARPSWRSLKYFRKVLNHKIDLAIAWNFENTILAAYRWLSDNYREGDRIFLFGFSRGAFQVRVLAAMIDKVGLIYKGNEEQIPFAYELYADPESDRSSYSVADIGSTTGQNQSAAIQGDEKSSYQAASTSMAARFKKAFSHDTANVHYVGVWDTVSSIGLARGNHMLPGTVDGMKHVCYFRQALALDERRVKFSPEYAYGGSAAQKEDTTGVPIKTPGIPQNLQDSRPPQSLEVWFAGTHSDIGGGNVSNEAMDRSRPPLRWMVFESAAAGLRTKPFRRVLSSTEQIEVKESLTGIWWILECLPLHRLTYTRRKNGTQATYKPHMGAPRKIHPGQKIHGSLNLTDKGRNEYTPKARPLDDDPHFWTNLRTKGLGDWKAVDLFEGTEDLLNKCLDRQDSAVWDLLRQTAMTVDGRQAVYEGTISLLQTRFSTARVTLSPEIDLISRVTDILEVTESYSAPLRKFNFETVRVAFDNCKGESEISVAKRFFNYFVTPMPKLKLEIHHVPFIWAAIFPDGTRFATVLVDGFVMVIDSATGTEIIYSPEHKHNFSPVVCAVSPNGKLIASGSQEGTVNLWDVETRTIIFELLEGHTKEVKSIGFSPDSKWLVSGSEDNTVRIWDVYSGRQIGDPIEGHGSVVAFKIIGGGKQVVLCSHSPSGTTAEIWDLFPHRIVGEPLHLVGSDELLLSAAFSSDGRRVVAGFMDGFVYVWDVEKRNMVGKLAWMYRDQVMSVAFSPDNRTVVSGTDHARVFFWDTETQRLENTFQVTDAVLFLSFLPDGKKIVTGCRDKMIRIWDTEPVKY